MKFCQPHWDKLNKAIDDLGLGSLVAESGQEAGKNLVSEFEDGVTLDNFDPLMMAHNAIWSKAMQDISQTYTQNPLMLMADHDEHPEWACPICALNWCHDEHIRLCTQENCDFPKEFNWEDTMITGASNLALEEWKRLKP